MVHLVKSLYRGQEELLLKELTTEKTSRPSPIGTSALTKPPQQTPQPHPISTHNYDLLRHTVSTFQKVWGVLIAAIETLNIWMDELKSYNTQEITEGLHGIPQSERLDKIRNYISQIQHILGPGTAITLQAPVRRETSDPKYDPTLERMNACFWMSSIEEMSLLLLPLRTVKGTTKS
jgi:hypothetical protein